MEAVRVFCIELGCEAVGELSVKPDSVQFTAVVPNAGQHEFGMTFSPEENAWSTSSWLRVRSFRKVSEIMFNAAQQNFFVRTSFAGMEIIYRRNDLGVIEVEQRPAIDPDTF